jgi:hypothetical protein
VDYAYFRQKIFRAFQIYYHFQISFPNNTGGPIQNHSYKGVL